MRWQELKIALREADDRIIIAVEFKSGKKITIRNVPKDLTTRPDFDSKVMKAAKKAKPNEVFLDWNIVGASEADKIDKVEKDKIDGKDQKDTNQGEFEPTDIEKQAMKNVLDLHRLVMNTMEKTVFRGLKIRDTDDPKWKDGWYHETRAKDPVFPNDVTFSFPQTDPDITGKTITIDDIKDALMIDLKINTNNPGRDEYGYMEHEGFPKTMGDFDDMKQMIIDAVGARDHITTVGPAQPKQVPNEPMKITIAAKSFYYRRAVVPKVDND